MPGFSGARAVLAGAIAEGAFPACVVEVGRGTDILWRQAFGRLHLDAAAPITLDDTIFDLASLTKVLATATLAMEQIERGHLGLDDAVARHLPSWRGVDREAVTIRDLLSHASGLPAHLKLFEQIRGRPAIEAAISATPLAYAPRSASVYSDLGFMLLGFILEGGISLADRFETLRQRVDAGAEVQFRPPPAWRPRTAPTEHDPWRGRLLVGEVHDENASALDGVAGHAGLFGTASAVGTFARHYLQVLAGRIGIVSRPTLETFVTRRTEIPGSSRALGWDTMLPTSSCGSRMSPAAFGHVGFTGTSLWIDPSADVYVVLLTNRVHPSRSNQAIGAVRRALHDAVMLAIAAGEPSHREE